MAKEAVARLLRIASRSLMERSESGAAGVVACSLTCEDD